MKSISLAEKNNLAVINRLSDAQEYFPSVTLRETGGVKLPDAGTITFEFRKVRSEEDLQDGDKKYRCTLELRAINDIIEDEKDSKPASNKNKDASDALDKLREKKMKELDNEEGDY
jgi:hypothetical protein